MGITGLCDMAGRRRLDVPRDRHCRSCKEPKPHTQCAGDRSTPAQAIKPHGESLTLACVSGGGKGRCDRTRANNCWSRHAE
jgi:hypothetical protein